MHREQINRPANDNKWLDGAAEYMPRPEMYHVLPPGNGSRTHTKTRILKDAILLAAELVGSNGRGNAGLVGYLKALAIHEPKSFTVLLAKVMPYQIAGVKNQPLRIISDNMDPQQAADAYAQTVQQITLMIEDRSNGHTMDTESDNGHGTREEDDT